MKKIMSKKIMSKWKRWLGVISMTLLSISLLVLIVSIALPHFLVDLWWFSSLDYGAYFWVRLLYRYLLSGAVTVIFFLIFFLNFWVAFRYLGIEQEIASESSSIYRRLLHLFQTGSLVVYTPLSLVLAIIIALPFYREWEAALLFLFGPDAGIRDPVYNNDVDFYLFAYPFYRLIQSELLATFIILTVSTALLYWVEHRLIPTQEREWPIGAKIHQNGLFLLTALVLVWGHMLERYGLLYVDDHEPLFFGPGFTEMYYQLPLVWVSIALFLGVAICATVFVHTRRGLRSLIVLGVLYGLAVGLRYVPTIPAALDRFIVKPNPVNAQKGFIENNINATLAAYDLNQVRTVDMKAAADPAEIARFDILDIGPFCGHDSDLAGGLWGDQPTDQVLIGNRDLRDLTLFKIALKFAIRDRLYFLITGPEVLQSQNAEGRGDHVPGVDSPLFVHSLPPRSVGNPFAYRTES